MTQVRPTNMLKESPPSKRNLPKTRGAVSQERVKETKFAKCRCYFLGVASGPDETNRLGNMKADKMNEQDELQNPGSKSSETDVAPSSRFRH